MKGLGIDAVSISKTRDLMEALGEAYVEDVYTPAEQRACERAIDRAEFLAGRFAVKEAAFKALAHLLVDETFDLRLVETMNDEDGSPHIVRTPELDRLLRQAGADDVLVSITTEADLAVAIVAVQ